MSSIYITLPQWTTIKTRRVGSDPYYVQSYVQRDAVSPHDTSLRVCITFFDEVNKSMFLLKYSEYL